MALRRQAERALLVLCVALASGSALAGSIICCDDVNGRRVCGDVVPPVCYSREYREISRQGTVKRVVEAPLTADERARRAANEQARKDAEEQARARELQERALLQTYASIDDIEIRRKRELDQIQRDLEAAQGEEANLLKQKADLGREAKPFEGKTMPRTLANRIADNRSELAAARSVIDSKARDVQAVNSRYDEDRRRYAELLARRPGGR
jgi:hypothetical protein